MKFLKTLIIFLTLVLLADRALAETSQIISLNQNALQGDTVVVTFLNKKVVPRSASFDGAPTSIFDYKDLYRVVFGVPVAKKPGIYDLKIKFADGKILNQSLRIRARKFPIVKLSVPEKLNLTPAGLVNKLQAAKSDLKNVFETQTPELFFSEPFGLPLSDNSKIVSPFGEVRKTGKEQIRHLGIDLAAATGTPVGAINAGIVRRAYLDPIYGNSVIIDHGEGLFSLYLHLDSIKVKEGDKLRKGSLIGTVGQTGYATSPHLHLSVKINNISVDPLKFIFAFD